jgi:hypothetical protein
MGLTAGPHLPVTGAKSKREAALAGPTGSKLGQPGLLAQARQRPLAWDPSRAKRKEERMIGSAREKEERRGRRLSFFKKIIFKFVFQLSNFNKQKSMHSNHDAQTLIISKLF